MNRTQSELMRVQVSHQCPQAQQDAELKFKGQSLSSAESAEQELPWPGQANRIVSKEKKKTHLLSLGQWQGSELGAGRVLQSKCHSPPHIYRLQLKSFWHNTVLGLRG